MPVSNYSGKMMEMEQPEYITEFQFDLFEMKVQALDCTLVDNVFAICDYYLQDIVQKYSRYLYNIYKLFPSTQTGLDVQVLCKSAFPKKAYKADYNNFTMKLLEEQVAYTVVIKTLTVIA